MIGNREVRAGVAVGNVRRRKAETVRAGTTSGVGNRETKWNDVDASSPAIWGEHSWCACVDANEEAGAVELRLRLPRGLRCKRAEDMLQFLEMAQLRRTTADKEQVEAAAETCQHER